jgi:hypothetical protein
VAVKVMLLLELSDIDELLADRETVVVIAGSMFAEPPHPDNAANTHSIKKLFIK